MGALWSWFWIQTLYFAGVHPEHLVVLYRRVRRLDQKACGGLDENEKTIPSHYTSRGLRQREAEEN